MDVGRVLVFASMASGMVAMPGWAWAHGGDRLDPPVPGEFFVVGVALTLVAAVVLFWRTGSEPSLRSTPRERMLDWPWLRPLVYVAGFVAVVLFLVGGVAGLVGSDDPLRNPLPVLVSPIFWPAIPLLAALLGNVYPALSPWQGLARIFGLGERERILHEERVGYRLGVVVFLLFAWMELVAPFGSDPRLLAVAVLVYSAYLLVYIEAVGRDTALESGDGFGVYAMLVAGIAPLEKTGGGDLVWRGWFRGLPQLPERPGLVAMVASMIGVVAFDGLAGTGWWSGTVEPLLEAIAGSPLSESWRRTVSGSIGLVLVIGVVWLTYMAAATATARVAGTSPSEAASRFAHALIPTAVAVTFGHYATAILGEGRRLLSLLSDPFGRGWDLLGTAGLTDAPLPDAGSAWLWALQVGAVLGGLLVGIVLVRERAASDLSDEGSILRVRIPISVFLVASAVGGLAILSAA